MTANERLAEIKQHIGSNTEHDLLAALEDVLELHRPIDVEPCDTICEACSSRLPSGRFMPTVEYPCPTVEAVNEALGEDQ